MVINMVNFELISVKHKNLLPQCVSVHYPQSANVNSKLSIDFCRNLKGGTNDFPSDFHLICLSFKPIKTN